MRRKQYVHSGCNQPKIASIMVCHSLTVVGEGGQGACRPWEAGEGRRERRQGEGRGKSSEV